MRVRAFFGTFHKEECDATKSIATRVKPRPRARMPTPDEEFEEIMAIPEKWEPCKLGRGREEEEQVLNTIIAASKEVHASCNIIAALRYIMTRHALSGMLRPVWKMMLNQIDGRILEASMSHSCSC